MMAVVFRVVPCLFMLYVFYMGFNLGKPGNFDIVALTRMSLSIFITEYILKVEIQSKFRGRLAV